MAEQEHEVTHDAEDADKDEEGCTSYVLPPKKSIEEILNQDAEDESLRKYKEALLGNSASTNVIIDANNPCKVIVQKLSLLSEGRDETFIDLTKPKEEIKKQSFTIKEGCKYRIKIYFYVQREIVSGLRYEHKVYKKLNVSLETKRQMMGSYAPKLELQSFTTQEDDAPQGLMARGDYKIKSRFYDDDKNEYVKWSWNLSVKKDW